MSLSEQQLMDCLANENGSSCEGGGSVDNAFRYIEKNGGLDTEECYPYRAHVSLLFLWLHIQMLLCDDSFLG